MYYRLAYALWRIGRTNEAVACYTMVLREPNTALAETARGELAELRQQIDDTRPPMAVAEAEQVLHAANIRFRRPKPRWMRWPLPRSG